jgi:hypothetical protein
MLIGCTGAQRYEATKQAYETCLAQHPAQPGACNSARQVFEIERDDALVRYEQRQAEARALRAMGAASSQQAYEQPPPLPYMAPQLMVPAGGGTYMALP